MVVGARVELRALTVFCEIAFFGRSTVISWRTRFRFGPRAVTSMKTSPLQPPRVM